MPLESGARRGSCEIVAHRRGWGGRGLSRDRALSRQRTNVCTRIGDSSETVGCAAGSFVFGGLPGFAIGALIDRAFPRKVSIVPVVRRGTIGVHASLRLGR